MKKADHAPIHEANQEKERMRKFEYRDAGGNFLGNAIVELDLEKRELFTRECLTLDGKFPIVQRLKRFDIVGSEGSLEVLPFLGVEVPIYIPTEPVRNFAFSSTEIIVPEPRSPLDIGTFFHEAGHERQEKEKRFLRLQKLNREGRCIHPLVRYEDKGEAMAKFLKSMRKIILSRKNKAVFTNEEIDNLIPLLQEDSKTKRLLKKWRSAADGNYQEINNKNYDIEEKLRPYLETMNEIIRLPLRLLEYDATRRAVAWALAIKKKTGVDLFAPCFVDQSASKDSNLHQDDVRKFHGLSPGKPERITNFLDSANEALRTYGADLITL